MKMDWRLIKRSFTSSLDEVDRRVLEAWLGESERHRQLYEEMKRFVAKRENFQLSVEAKKQFKREFDSRIDEAYRRRGRRVWLKVVSYAAMLALPIIAGILLWTRQPVEEVVDYGIGPIKHGARKATLVLNDGKVLALDTSRMTLKESDGVTIHTNDQALVYVDSLDNKGDNLQNRLITPKGGEYTIMLADGTKVWVNAATEIRYPVKFAGKERRVRLEGEAYFEVTKGVLSGEGRTCAGIAAGRRGRDRPRRGALARRGPRQLVFAPGRRDQPADEPQYVAGAGRRRAVCRGDRPCLRCRHFARSLSQRYCQV